VASWPPGSRWNMREDLPREIRPSDSLLRAHLVQALLRWVVRRPDDMQLTSWPAFANAFRGPLNDYFDVDLSHPRWTADAGKQVLEQYLMHRLYGCLPPLLQGPGEDAERKRQFSGVRPVEYLVAKRERAQRSPGDIVSPVSRRRKRVSASRWGSSNGANPRSVDTSPSGLRDGSSSEAASSSIQASKNAAENASQVEIEMWPENFYRSFSSPGYVPSPARPLKFVAVTKDAGQLEGTVSRGSQTSTWSFSWLDEKI
jgi:hypothetical protein